MKFKVNTKTHPDLKAMMEGKPIIKKLTLTELLPDNTIKENTDCSNLEELFEKVKVPTENLTKIQDLNNYSQLFTEYFENNPKCKFNHWDDLCEVINSNMKTLAPTLFFK